MGQSGTTTAIKWLRPEYCDGPFYMGWWLYLRDRNDGSENDDGWDRWGWLRRMHQLRPVRDLMISLGHVDVPELPYQYDGAGNEFRRNFRVWFAEHYPNGLQVSVTFDSVGRPKRYEVVGATACAEAEV